MTLGVIQYVAGRKRFGNVGLKPSGRTAERGTVARQALTGEEWKRIGAMGVLFFFAALFWGAFEQAGSSLNLFADRVTDNSVLGWSFPSTWYLSLNAIFIFALAPVFAWLWVKMGRRNPSSPTKFALGLLFVGLGFLVVAVASSRVTGTQAKVSPMWLVVLYFLHTVGELCLSPVGLSTVTKLAPARMVGSMMGLWFLSLALGNKIGGWVAGFFEKLPLPQLFGDVFLTTIGAAIVLFFLVRPIKKLMGGVS